MITFNPCRGMGRGFAICLGVLGYHGMVSGTFAAELGSPSQAAVDAAKGVSLMSYDRDFSGGAHTNAAWNGGAAITLALASHAGNTTADARLLQQIRHTLTPGKEPTSNGGYPEQHNRHATGMFVIVRNTPTIWSQLTAAEKARIDLIMKASLVANAFTTSDNNPFIKGGTQQYTLDADSNVNRGWNPNYQEGMIGGVLNGLAYFGGPGPTNALLTSYDHNAFVTELADNNLPNIHETFNWKTANPSSKAPTASQIQAGVRNYLLHSIPLSNYTKIYQRLVTNTYGSTVNSGLNNGAGIAGAGRIASGAESLPNKGSQGMLQEFDSNDANGPRSSFTYSYDGYRPHMTNQICLIVSGLWPKGSAIAVQATALMNVGNTDLWYKAEKGYLSYAKGSSRGLADYTTHGASHGFVYNRSLWEDVLKPFHGLGGGGGGGGGGEPTEFSAGTRIQIPTSVTIRASASGSAASTGILPPGTLASVAGGPVSEGENEWWQIFADSGMVGWILRSGFEPAPATEFLDSTGGTWKNRVIPTQTGSFSISFNLWAGGAGIDAVTGLSAGDPAGFSDLAVAIRFAPTGVFDARNGGTYQAVNTLTYQAGVLYRVILSVNTAARLYSATVTPPGGSPVEIASNYAFRTEQASITSLSRLAAFAAPPASHVISGVSLLGAGVPPSAPTGLRVVGGE